MTLNKLINAVENYNACNLSLINNGVFNHLISARNKHFRKKILLVNLREAPANAHMEHAFVRAVADSGKNMALDIVHSFKNDYSFIGRGNRTGFRIRCSGMAELKDFTAKTKYCALIFIDLPYRDEDLVSYAWLALRDKTPEKFFIANDILLPRGSIFGMDLAEDLRLLKDFSAVYILNQHSADEWGRFGLPQGRVFERDLAVDCSYYDGKESMEGDYAYSCGQAARNFDVLFKAAGAMPRRLKFKIYTGLQPRLPAKLKSRVELVPYSRDSSEMKKLIAGAKFVILPVGRDNGNPCAGLTVSLIAMAMKKIVLTRGNSCIHRYLKNGVNAFTYTELDASELSRGIKRILLLSPKEKDRITANARKTVLKINNIDSFARAFLDKHC